MPAFVEVPSADQPRRPGSAARALLVAAACVLAACATTQSAQSNGTASGNQGANANNGSGAPVGDVKISTRAMLQFEDANKTWEQQKAQPHPDYAQVARKFESALAADDHLAEADYNLGVLAERQGHLDEAQVHYKAALRKKPSMRQAAENLAVLQQNNGDAQGALSVYGEIARQFPDDANSRARMAEIYRQAGDDDKAQEYARQALIREPKNVLAYRTLMYSYIDKKQLPLARLVAVRGLKLDEHDPEFYFGLGLVQMAENHPEAATVQFNRSLEQKADFIPAHVYLAKLAIRNDDFTGAEAHLTRILKADPKNAEAHLALGVAYKGEGQFDKAMLEYDQAQKYNPNLPAIYLNRGIILQRHKDAPEKALEYYKKYTEMVGVGLAADAPVHALQKEAEQIVTARNDAKRQEEENKKMQEMQKRQQDQMKQEEQKEKGTAKKTPTGAPEAGAGEKTATDGEKPAAKKQPASTKPAATNTEPAIPINPDEPKSAPQKTSAAERNPKPAPAVKETKDKDEPVDGL